MKKKIVSASVSKKLEERLLSASQDGDEPEVRELLQQQRTLKVKFSLHPVTPEGLTPFLLAVQGRHEACINLFVAARASLMGQKGQSIYTVDPEGRAYKMIQDAVINPRAVAACPWTTEHKGDDRVGTVFGLRYAHGGLMPERFRLAVLRSQHFSLVQLLDLYDNRGIRDFFSEGNIGVKHPTKSEKKQLAAQFAVAFQDLGDTPTEIQTAMYELFNALEILKLLRPDVNVHPLRELGKEFEQESIAKFFGPSGDEFPGVEYMDKAEGPMIEGLKTFLAKNPGKKVACLGGSMHMYSRHLNSKTFNPLYLSKDCG
jgi:hypothetical protein